jgi:hypothetical protein
MSIEDLIDEYIRLRDKKSEIEAEAKRIKEKLDQKMDALENDILKKFKEVGVESARTNAGTAFIKTTRSTSVAEWDSFLPWVQATDNWHMLTRAANKTAVLEFLDESEELPPGINLYSKIELGINRPKPTRKAA